MKPVFSRIRHSMLTFLTVPLTLLFVPLTSISQTQRQWSNSSSETIDAPEPTSSAGSSTRGYVTPPAVYDGMRPFSRLALGVAISPLGIGLQTTTNINQHFNIRAAGNFFQYNANNFSAQGFNVNANIHLASARTSVDYYPFHKGFRLSPGVMFYNQNHVNATFVAATGTSFTLNDHTYYSASGQDAVQGKGVLGLGNGSPAFTMTTGWGNVIPRSGRHLTFPFEIGVAFTKTPTFSLGLTGNVCDAQGQNCVNVATDPTAQADLAAQVKKYRDDLEPLKTYPIVSFGVAYSFGTRSGWGR